jgi:hypothetical protein
MTFLAVCLPAMSSDLHLRKFIIDTDPGKEKAKGAIGLSVSSSALFTLWSGSMAVLIAYSCGLYYKHMTIVNDDSSIIIKRSFKLIDTAKGVIYDCHMFIVQAADDVFYERHLPLNDIIFC